MIQKLQCELCGSVDILKTAEDLFQCQHCGCKYTLEQVRYLIHGKVTAMQPDFTIRAGKLIRYNGEATEVNIPGNVRHIATDAFRFCDGLTKITIPYGVETIEPNAFHRCTRLASINLPDSLLEIGEGAFIDCTSLTSVSIPDSITTIADHTFAGCTSLTHIDIPDHITEIRTRAFEHCPLMIERYTRKRCIYCGDKLTFFRKACKSCGRISDENTFIHLVGK